MTRVLFPHDMLDDRYYAKVVEALDQSAQTDDATRDQLIAGIAQLDNAKGVRFHTLSAEDQLEVVKGVEGSDFFATVRETTVWTLYPDPEVWSYFGYEGSSVEHGGYINRGFNDIDWLP